MRLLITSLIILFNTTSLSLSKEREIIESHKFRNGGFIEVLCLRGYEFVMVCEERKGECNLRTDQIPNIQQIITEEGGGKKC